MFINDSEYIGASFGLMLQSGISPDKYVMVCGRGTLAQRDIIKRRCTINADDYEAILSCLMNNHPSYYRM